MAGTSLEALEPWRGADCYFFRCESTRTLNCADYPFCKSELPRGLIPYMIHSDPYVSLPLIHAGRVKCCDPATMRNRSAIFTSRSEELMTHFGRWEFWLTLLRSAQDGANRKQWSRNQATLLILSLSRSLSIAFALPIRDESSVILLLCGYINHNLRICKFQRWTTLQTSSSFEWTEIYIERLPSP